MSSVITERGDLGETDLMYGRRVAKTHPRIVTNGSLDELNAMVGLVRVYSKDHPSVPQRMAELQGQLIQIMGEIATLPEDQERYRTQFGVLGNSEVINLTHEARELENDLNTRFSDWAIPGEHAHPGSAYLDMARTLCRRAERELLTLPEDERPQNVARYLNRLSDFLWLVARQIERE